MSVHNRILESVLLDLLNDKLKAYHEADRLREVEMMFEPQMSVDKLARLNKACMDAADDYTKTLCSMEPRIAEEHIRTRDIDTKQKTVTSLREHAASFFLCNDNIAEALELLDNAEDGSPVPNEVIVWEKFEYEPLDNLITYLDDLESLLKRVKDEV